MPTVFITIIHINQSVIHDAIAKPIEVVRKAKI